MYKRAFPLAVRAGAMAKPLEPRSGSWASSGIGWLFSEEPSGIGWLLSEGTSGADGFLFGAAGVAGDGPGIPRSSNTIFSTAEIWVTFLGFVVVSSLSFV